MTAALTSSTATSASEQLGQSASSDAEVDAHPDGDQEDAEAEPAERRGDHLDLAAIFGLGDDDAGDQRAEDRREADRARSPGWRRSRPAGRPQEQLRALGPRRLGEQRRQQQPAERTASRRDHARRSASSEQRSDAAPPACGAIAPSRNTIGTSARSSNSSMPSADRPTGLWVPTSGSTSAVEDRASARPSADRAGRRLARRRYKPAADQRRASRAARPRRRRTPAGASPTAGGTTARARSRTAAGRCRARRTARSRAGWRSSHNGARDASRVSAPRPNGPTSMPIRMKPMTGVIRAARRPG